MLTFHLLKKISSLARGNDEDEAVNFIGSATVVGGMMGAARMSPLLSLFSFLSLHPLYVSSLIVPSFTHNLRCFLSLLRLILLLC